MLRLTQKQAAKLPGVCFKPGWGEAGARGLEAKPHKYNARKVTIDGITFDSKKEGNRYVVLKLQERLGLISDLELQPKFILSCGGVPAKIKSKGYPNGRIATYRADFRYACPQRGSVVEDAKGKDTYDSRLKRALIEAEYGVTVEII